MEAVYVNAGNDRNGNPRRGWIIVEGGLHRAFVDEGYVGAAALRERYPALEAHGPALIITPGQWRHLRAGHTLYALREN